LTLSRTARAVLQGATTGPVVYVSLPPGTIENGGLATIRNTRIGTTVSTAMMAGGFDPIPIEAQAGDSLALEVLLAGGGRETRGLRVPKKRPPVVVRTDPPPRKRDVALNATIMVVFSEPIDPASVGSVRLLRGGVPVPGSAVVSADGLRVVFAPGALLDANTDYVIAVSTALTDRDGDQLEAATTAEFTTGSTVVVASAATAQAALVIHPSGNLQRTIDFRASLTDDDSITGDFNIFYPEAGYLIFGRVTCLTIVDDSLAWVGATVDGAVNPDRIGGQLGWRVIDHGSGPVPDQISLAYPLIDTTAQDFCASTPTEDIEMYDLLSGDVVVNPSGPPPPPPPTPPGGMSRIASVGTHDGGIKVVHADGTGGRVLTTDRDWSPAWSPDGSRLAFDRERIDGGADIYVINADGSGVTRLTNTTAHDTDPAWSPNGQQIAFTRDGVLHVMNANGTGVTSRSLGGGEHNPSWSPDGTRILVNRWDPGSDGWRIWAVNTNGSGATALTFGPGDDHHPRWSPDGRHIAFARVFDQSGNSGLYVMNADGSAVRRLTLGINGPPTWSPDGSRIAYELFGLNMVMLDGSGLRTVGSGFEPAWSPTGRMPAAPTPFRSLVMVSGDEQAGDAGATLPESLRVKVVRDDGSPVAGVVVRWNAWGGQGPVDPHPAANTAVTGPDGIASVQAILGSSGPARFRAALTDGTGRVPEVIFTATVRTIAERLEALNFGSAMALLTTNSTHEYVVVAYDGLAQPLAGVPVTWTLTTGDGSVAPRIDTTSFDPAYEIPTSRAVHTVGPNEGPAIVTAALQNVELTPVTRSATVVTAIVNVFCSGFTTSSVSVPSGRTVGWAFSRRCNRGAPVPHNVTFEDDPSLSSANIALGTFTRAFAGGPRTIRYRCTLHSTDFESPSDEVGAVIVQ
jgi:hypothetical protein